LLTDDVVPSPLGEKVRMRGRQNREEEMPPHLNPLPGGERRKKQSLSERWQNLSKRCGLQLKPGTPVIESGSSRSLMAFE
jgi:hypothetical protein